MINIGIYKITSTTGKINIGQSINIKVRKNKYKYLQCKNQPKIFNSIKKYGWDKHKFEIIEECKIEDLDERELYWKQYYNTVEDGLNCCYFDYSPMKGRNHSIKSKLKISKGLLGKKNSKETIERKSNSHKKPVIQYDLQGNFIKEYSSFKDAGIELNISSTTIGMCCRGKTKTSFNSLWKYKV